MGDERYRFRQHQRFQMFQIQATLDQLKSIEGDLLGFDLQKSLDSGLTLEQIAIRAYSVFFTDGEESSDLDLWINHCDSQGWDAEAIDIALGLC